MCGSTRFADLMACISWEFEKMGSIVLRVNYVPEWYAQREGWKENSHGAEHVGLKEQLDDLHLRKIDMCDFVYVCNYKGYIGDSTRAEIEYAKKIGKPIQWLWIADRYNDAHKDSMYFIQEKLSQWYDDFNKPRYEMYGDK